MMKGQQKAGFGLFAITGWVLGMTLGCAPAPLTSNGNALERGCLCDFSPNSAIYNVSTAQDANGNTSSRFRLMITDQTEPCALAQQRLLLPRDANFLAIWVDQHGGDANSPSYPGGTYSVTGAYTYGNLSGASAMGTVVFESSVNLVQSVSGTFAITFPTSGLFGGTGTCVQKGTFSSGVCPSLDSNVLYAGW